MRRPPRARRLRLSQLSLRRWPLWLVAAALLLGTVPVHSDLERHGAIGAPTHVWLEQCPPGTARHLEASTSVEVPRCVACLLQLQSKGALLAAPRPLGTLALAGIASETPQRPLAGAPLRLPSSRGPPLA
ncbi:MAG TPA: hypothetical protein VN923_02895 [Thermoanaerobaculia bacterium]|nr:hypothetical protein [Thermoanaerobaculia bacterium]